LFSPYPWPFPHLGKGDKVCLIINGIKSLIKLIYANRENEQKPSPLLPRVGEVGRGLKNLDNGIFEDF